MISPAPDSTVPAFYGARFQEDPVQLYREIREQHGPVAPIRLEGDVPAWLVLGYRELRYVTSNPHLFARTSRIWHGWDDVSPEWSLRPYVQYQPCSILTDADEHRRLSPALHDALTEIDQIDLNMQVQRLADRLIDEFAGRGEADLVEEYAHPLPLRTLAWIFGFPEAEVPVLIRDVALTGQEGAEAVRAHGRIVGQMLDVVRQKHELPGDDLPSRIIAHPVELSDEEIAQDLFLTLGASQLALTAWIGSALRLMFTDDRFAASLAGGRRSVGQALTEVLWAEAPCQNFIGRFAVGDTQLGGRHIARGDLLVLGIAGANDDPLVRGAASGGDNQAHMSFSHGEHGCPFPAQEIAFVVAEAAIQVLLDRLPDIRLAVPASELSYRPTVWLRGLNTLPVRFTPVYA